MRKNLFAVFFSAVVALSLSSQNVLGQTGTTPQTKQSDVKDGFYSAEFLKADYKEAKVVVYVNVKSRQLVDQLGGGNCEQNTGAGYCLYLLKAEVKEVFKGKVETNDFEFYTMTEAGYQNKDWLLGEKVAFLDWSDNYPNKQMSLGTIENSTRAIEQNVLESMRRIAKTKSNKKQ